MIISPHSAFLWPSWVRFFVMLGALAVLDAAWGLGLLLGTSNAVSHTYAAGTTHVDQLVGMLFAVGWVTGVVLTVLLLRWASRQQHKPEVLAAFISILWLTVVCAGCYFLALVGA